jgi:hypothetical protein
MTEDRHGMGLHDTQAERRTSPLVKLVGYTVVALLVLAIILLTTGIVEMSPLGGP